MTAEEENVNEITTSTGKPLPDNAARMFVVLKEGVFDVASAGHCECDQVHLV